MRDVELIARALRERDEVALVACDRAAGASPERIAARAGMLRGADVGQLVRRLRRMSLIRPVDYGRRYALTPFGAQVLAFARERAREVAQT